MITTRKQLVRKSAELKLELYSDGILLGKGPFRAIQNCSQFLQDLQDGFFPAELQAKYPDGVIFDLHDFHTKVNAIIAYISSTRDSELCSIIPWSWKIAERLSSGELQRPKFNKNR